MSRARAGVAGREIVVASDRAAVARLAADRFALAAQNAIAARGRFAVALAGGDTPRALYAELGRRTDIQWENVDLFWGDERAVPADHPDSNYNLAHTAFLASSPAQRARVHRMPADSTDLDEAALEYENELRQLLGTPPRLDLVLLGLGEDGHTLSLFPGQPAVAERARYVVATPAPRIAPRLTLTFAALDAAGAALFLVTGAAKAAILARVLAPPVGNEPLPAQQVVLRDGRVTWLVDRAARPTPA